MVIELIIGISGAILITGIFVRRENNRRNQRGKVLTKTLIKESIVPLRSQARIFIDLLKKASKTGTPKPDELVLTWGKLKDWKIRISPLFAISGDVINAKQQVLLSRILEDLEMKLDFNYVEMDQSHIHGLDVHLTDYLKMNKNLVKEVNNDMKSIMQEKIEQLCLSNSASMNNMIAVYKSRIQENEDTVKDIIDD